MNKRQKFFLLAGLYLAQGLPYGFFTQALPVMMRKSNLSLSLIGMSHLLTLPWALKFLWAPAVDRFHWPRIGLRRSWLLPIQFASAATYAALGLLTLEQSLLAVLVAFLLTNLLAASQDVATDGLAIDILTSRERGWANGLQVSFYRLGMIIGGGALLGVYEALQWSGVMISMAVLALLCTAPVILYRERDQRREVPIPKSPTSLADATREVLHFFTKPGARLWLLVLLLYKFGHASATSMLRPWLVDHGYGLTDIAWILGTAGFTAGFAGALVGGAIASRYSRTRLLVGLGLLQSIAVTSYLLPILSAHATWKVALAASFDHFTSGMATATLFAVMMDACSRDRAASDYTAQACTVVVSQGLSAAVAGASAQAFGYDIHFFLSAALAIGGVAATALLLRRPAIASLVSPSGA